MFNVLEYTKAIVIGGYANGEYLSSVELIDLSNEGKDCPSLPNYPLRVEYLTAEFYQGNVIACGGYLSTLVNTDKCYSLGSDLSSWEELRTPLYGGPRRNLASSIIDDKIFITGGYDDVDLKSTLVYDGSQFLQGPDLLHTKYYHCQLTLNSTHIFITSGGYETFLLNWETEEFVLLDDIPKYMDAAACGLLKNENYGLEVLVAEEGSSFIFSFTDLLWRNGPKIPNNAINPASAPTKNGFLSIGGYSRGSFYTSVYKFNEISYEWVEEEAVLQTGRQYATAVAVSDDFVKCQ